MIYPDLDDRVIFKTTSCKSRRLLRCSRPLCSSQHTVGTPCLNAIRVSAQKSEKPAPARHCSSLAALAAPLRCPVPQDPTACMSRPSPSDAFQQKRSSRVLAAPASSRPLSQSSTHELPPRHIRSRCGFWLHDPRADSRCSLERR